MGFAAAKLALEAGAKVAIASSSQTRVDDAVKRLKSSFPKAQVTGYTCDVQTEGIEARIEKLLNSVTAGGSVLLDHIVYTAGQAPLPKPLKDTDIETLIKETQLGFAAPLTIAKLAPRFLKKSNPSSLTFTSGQVAEKPLANYSAHSAIAAGLLGMVRNLALDMAPLRVNLVSPGPTRTEMWNAWGDNLDQIEAAVARNALLGKVGTAEELGEAYVYLMRNSDATGSCVSSNGGTVLK